MAATSSIPDRVQRPPFATASEAPTARRHGRSPRAELDAFEDEAEWPFDAEPSERSVRRVRPARRSLPWFRIGLTSAAVIAGMTYLAKRERQENETAAAPIPQASMMAPPPLWEPIDRPAPLYAVEGADGKALPAAFEARRHANGGREDTLTFGVFGEAGYARVSIASGKADRDSGRFYVDLVRRAAGSGLSVVRSGQSEAVATKFGAVEAASTILADREEQGCLAFRFAQDDLSFGFQGWLCGSQTNAVSTGQLACFIDRLALTSAADDQPLRVLFAQSDRHRLDACARPSRAVATKPGPNRS